MGGGEIIFETKQQAPHKWKPAVCLSVHFRIVCPAEDVINADAEKIGKNDQRIRRGNALAGFVFGNQGLLYTGFHLKRKLGQTALLAELAKVGLHLNHQFYSGILYA